ncbi:hypothetical protein AMECASPLE_028877 [Ameca splendens]|uniref:Uncharacterized protein n=1 Tax=Ameca splendens TaxID=208324 RepID=A0ABV0Z3G1_9TELE
MGKDMKVVKLGHSALVKALLDAGGDPNVSDRVQQLTVIHDAAREGFLDSVRVLIDHGADVNHVDQKGNLPLHLAAREGHLEVVKLLQEHTVDSQAANSEENTALMLQAAENG